MLIWPFLVGFFHIWTWLFLPPAEAKNLLLISVDTLRADRLSCYGYRENPTPRFDRWASEGFLFEQAFSEYPLTLPAHATMLTGQIPPRHGVRENAGYRLASEQTTLAEALHARNYRTAAFIGSYVLAAEFGVSQGFEIFDEEFATSIANVGASTELQRPAPEVTARFLGWLRHSGDKPFFAFVHFYDPHTPRPEGYDREVTRVDESLGEIDAFLRETGLLEKTDIVLTSDHGESLGDHGEEGHGFFVYDSTLHVPLIVRPAGSTGKRGRRINHQVSLADLMPTILDRLRIPIPSTVQGRSLNPLFSGNPVEETALYSESFVPQLHFGWSPLRSLRLGQYKYIDAPRPELYDVAADQGEVKNLFSERPTVAREYRKKLLHFVEDHGVGEHTAKPEEPDPETVRKLLSLGYLNTGSNRRKSDSAPLVDPKDRIAAFERYHAILSDLALGRLDPRAPEKLAELESWAPEIQGIRYLQAWALELSGNLKAARARYQLAVTEQPDNAMARARFAGVLMKLQELREAESQLQEVLKRAPSDYRSMNNLAGLYRMTGRTEQAVEQIRRITQARPDYLPAWQNLGRLEAEAGNWRAAEDAFVRVTQLDPRSAVAHLELGYALRAQGRLDEAAREEEQAYLLNPELRRK